MNTQFPTLDDAGDDPALRLSDTLCARLCHDLASPLGTLMGALELALEDPTTAEEALPLASEVATAMGQRLRLLRAAWAGDCGPLSRDQLADLATGLPPRVTAQLDRLEDGGYPAPLARALINLLLLAADALPLGGRIALAGGPAADILLTVDGPNAGWPAGLAGVITAGAAPDIGNPRSIQIPLAAMLARVAGRKLVILLAPGPAGGAPPLLLTALPAPQAAASP